MYWKHTADCTLYIWMHKCIHLACNCKATSAVYKYSFRFIPNHSTILQNVPTFTSEFFKVLLILVTNLPAFFCEKSIYVCSHNSLFFLPIPCTNCSPRSDREIAELLGGGDGWVEQKLHFPLKGRGRSTERTERPFIPIKKRRGKSSTQWRWKILYPNPGKNLFFLHWRIDYSQHNSHSL